MCTSVWEFMMWTSCEYCLLWVNDVWVLGDVCMNKCECCEWVKDVWVNKCERCEWVINDVYVCAMNDVYVCKCCEWVMNDVYVHVCCEWCIRMRVVSERVMSDVWVWVVSDVGVLWGSYVVDVVWVCECVSKQCVNIVNGETCERCMMSVVRCVSEQVWVLWVRYEWCVRVCCEGCVRIWVLWVKELWTMRECVLWMMWTCVWEFNYDVNELWVLFNCEIGVMWASYDVIE